jgi:hypothetical protein
MYMGIVETRKNNMLTGIDHARARGCHSFYFFGRAHSHNTIAADGYSLGCWLV